MVAKVSERGQENAAAAEDFLTSVGNLIDKHTSALKARREYLEEAITDVKAAWQADLERLKDEVNSLKNKLAAADAEVKLLKERHEQMKRQVLSQIS